MKQRTEDISSKVLTYVLRIVLCSLVVITCFICVFLCLYIKNKHDHENQNALNQYVWQVSNAISDGIERSNNILTWPLISEGLTSMDADTYKRLEFVNNVHAYITNISNEDSFQFIIYSGNDNIFISKYILRLDSLTNREVITSILKTQNKYIEKTIYNTGENEYIKIFSDIGAGNGSILECDVIIPKPPMDFDISVVTAEKAKDMKGTLHAAVDENFAAVLSADMPKLYKKQLGAVSVTLLIGVIIFMLLIFIIRHSVTKTLSQVTSVIKHIDEADLSLAASEKSTGETAGTDVEMLKKTVSNLLVRLVEVSNEKNKLDIYMMRKQLDPHTLYNSLSVIRLRAHIKGDYETVELVDDMVDYYRSILNKGNLYDTIEKELFSIEKFLKITGAANGKKYTLTHDIEDGLEKFEMPSMLLHVFVENSVVHGMSAKPGAGRIDITARRLENKVEITISDDGYGIENDKLAQLNNLDANIDNL